VGAPQLSPATRGESYVFRFWPCHGRGGPLVFIETEPMMTRWIAAILALLMAANGLFMLGHLSAG
jgi:hypothetical protein